MLERLRRDKIAKNWNFKYVNNGMCVRVVYMERKSVGKGDMNKK